MRLWGWWNDGEISAIATVTWIPLLLAEFACTAGTVNGPAFGTETRQFRHSDYLCDTVTVTRGSALQVMSDPLGSWLKIDLQGCMKFQFDFRQGDNGLAYGNALWLKMRQI